MLFQIAACTSAMIHSLQRSACVASGKRVKEELRSIRLHPSVPHPDFQQFCACRTTSRSCAPFQRLV